MRTQRRSRPRADPAVHTQIPPAAPAPEHRVPSMVAGFAVVRRLSGGRRSDIYLGHSAANSVSQVALKVFHATIPADSVEREIAALGAVCSGLVELIDVATLPDGRVCLVLERLRGPSLAHYLMRYAPLCAGEAVTILAPVVVCLHRLHGTGFSLNSLSQASIVIDERGRPVVLGLGSLASLPEPGANRTAVLRADYARLAVLIAAVLGAVEPGHARLAARAALVARCEAAAEAASFVQCLPQIERHLFDWAPATALSFGRSAPAGSAHNVSAKKAGAPLGAQSTTVDASSPLLARIDKGEGEGDDDDDWTNRPDFRASGAASGANAAEERRHERLDCGAQRLASRIGLVADSVELFHAFVYFARNLRTRLMMMIPRPQRAQSGTDNRPVGRRWNRVVYAAGLACAATVAALMLVPAAATDTPPGLTKPVASAPSPTELRAAPNDSTILAADEPVEAVRVLLRLRAQCLALASVTCLDGTDQPDGPLLAVDTASIAATPSLPGFTLAGDGGAELIERTGNSALVALTVGPQPSASGYEQRQPASVLVIKGEAGWRMRELFYY